MEKHGDFSRTYLLLTSCCLSPAELVVLQIRSWSLPSKFGGRHAEGGRTERELIWSVSQIRGLCF